MRFRRFQAAIIVLLVMATYVAYLGLSNQLDLYIHPRYIVFTLTMAIIGLAVVLIDAYFEADTTEHGRGRRSSVVPLVFLLFLAIILPAQTLTSATVSQRTTDAGSLVTTAEAEPIDTLFAGSSRGLGLADWTRLLARNNDPSYYANRPAKLSGFIYDAELGDNTVWLARFVVTCCAVDAQPVGVPVQLMNWQSDYKQDEWIEVEGEFELAPTAQGEQIVLIPSQVTKIERPSNPYAN